MRIIHNEIDIDYDDPDVVPLCTIKTNNYKISYYQGDNVSITNYFKYKTYHYKNSYCLEYLYKHNDYSYIYRFMIEKLSKIELYFTETRMSSSYLYLRYKYYYNTNTTLLDLYKFTINNYYFLVYIFNKFYFKVTLSNIKSYKINHGSEAYSSDEDEEIMNIRQIKKINNCINYKSIIYFISNKRIKSNKRFRFEVLNE